MSDRPEKRVRVLIADDENMFLSAFRHVFQPQAMLSAGELARSLERYHLDPPQGWRESEPMQYDVQLCNNGRQAVHFIRQGLTQGYPYGVAILDANLQPGLNGIGAALAIRDLDPHIQIIIVAEHSDQEAFRAAQAILPNECLFFIRKPFNTEDVAQLGKALASKWWSLQTTQRPRMEQLPAITPQVKELIRLNEELRKKFDKMKENLKTAQISEQWFHAIYEYAPDAIFLMDFSGQVIDGNRQAENLVGLARHEVIGKNFFELKLIDQEQIPLILQNLQACRMGEPVDPEAYDMVRADETRLRVEVSIHGIRINERELVIGMIRDISAREH